MRSERNQVPAPAIGETVGVFGLGRLGAPIAAAIAASGRFDVVGFDVDNEKIAAVNAGRPPVKELHLAEYMERAGDSFVAAYANEEEVARYNPRAFLVVVPTPSESSGRFSGKYVEQVCLTITRSLAARPVDASTLPLIVVISTLMPGAMAALEQAVQGETGLQCGRDYLLAYSPTFIALGQVIEGFLRPGFLLVGESHPATTPALLHLYRQVQVTHPPVAKMSYENAELAKLALNCYVTMKISYANFLAELCEKMPGGDVGDVTYALGLDRRISPFFFTGATPFGGPCFPRDLVAMEAHAAGLDVSGSLPAAINTINKLALVRIFDMAVEALPPGGKAAVLGMAYKKGTHVLDESAGARLAHMLGAVDCVVSVYDPCFGGEMTAQECVDFADVVVIALPYEEFQGLSFRPGQVVVDCWRILGKVPEGVKLIQVGVHHA